MLAITTDIHVLRDPTCGGVASALNEIAQASHVGMALDERSIPVQPAVASACEMLGLDPMYVANEGKLIAIVPAAQAEAVLAAMRRHPLGKDAAIIGQIVASHPGRVVARTGIGEHGSSTCRSASSCLESVDPRFDNSAHVPIEKRQLVDRRSKADCQSSRNRIARRSCNSAQSQIGFANVNTKKPIISSVGLEAKRIGAEPRTFLQRRHDHPHLTVEQRVDYLLKGVVRIGAKQG